MLFRAVLQLTTTAAGLLAGLADAVAVNPLPAPQSIVWGTSGPKQLSGYLVFNATYNQIVDDAWSRAFNTITTLKWVPVAVEAPISTYAPFPTASARLRRSSSELIQVDLSIANEAADLQQGVDESYTLAITQDSQSINITAQTVWELYMHSRLCSRSSSRMATVGSWLNSQCSFKTGLCTRIVES